MHRAKQMEEKMKRKKIIGSDSLYNARNPIDSTNAMNSINRFLRFALRSLLSALFVLFALSSMLCTAYAADKLAVKDSSGNIQFVVKDDGKVGIGTTTPMSRFSITDQTSDFNRGFLLIQTGNFAAAGKSSFYRSRGTEASPTAVQNGDYIGAFSFLTYTGTQYIKNISFGAVVNGTVTSNSVDTDLFFTTSITNDTDPYANGTVRLLIKSNGNVGIGTTNPSYPLQMKSGAYCSTGGVWTNASSREYKENIKDLSADEAMVAFNRLDPVTFNYKVNKEERHVGFIAEDVPDLVATKDRKGLSSMDIAALLTRVIQEQEKKISDLSEKVNNLQKLMELNK